MIKQNNPSLLRLMGKVKRNGCILAMLVASNLSLAETVAVPLGQQGKAWNVDAPSHGLQKDQVISQFGEPITRTGPVGEPPIYTWVYDQFTVYFEGDHVIHSVVKYRPEQTRQQN